PRSPSQQSEPVGAQPPSHANVPSGQPPWQPLVSNVQNPLHASAPEPCPTLAHDAPPRSAPSQASEPCRTPSPQQASPAGMHPSPQRFSPAEQQTPAAAQAVPQAAVSILQNRQVSCPGPRSKSAHVFPLKSLPSQSSKSLA